MLRETYLLIKKLVGETMSYFLWEREKRYTKPLFHLVLSADMHCFSCSIYLLSFNKHFMT
jgi:hypothetical protein